MDDLEAREAIAAAYVSVGFEAQPLAEIDDHSLHLTLAGVKGTFVIAADDVHAYAEAADESAKLAPTPVPASFASNSYREQRVSFDGPECLFGDPSSSYPFVRIGPASKIYRSRMIVEPEVMLYFRGRFERYRGFNYNSFLHRIKTISIFNVNAHSIERSIDVTEEIINSVVFRLLYTENLNLSMFSSWPAAPAVSALKEDDKESSIDIKRPFAQVLYITDLVRFYQRGASDMDPFVQFLSFYHVPEYFFVTLSDASLYKKMSQILNAPSFSTNPRDLDRLIVSMSSHKSETDETEMLKMVLKEFVTEDDLIEYIKNSPVESSLSKPKSCFGYQLDKVSVEKGHVFGSVAKRIKTIRNALVHSSDRYERKERYVPGLKAYQTLRPEIPLLRFLAGAVIVGSATPRVT